MKILQPAFYASHRPGLVLAVSVVMVLVNIILSITLMPVYGHLGLALATSVSGLFAAVTLFLLAVRSGYIGILPVSGLVRIVAACIAMAMSLVAIDSLLPPIASWLEMGALVGGGSAVFLVAALMLRAMPPQLVRG